MLAEQKIITRQEYGMIRFDGEPFDVSESYMRLMLEG